MKLVVAALAIATVLIAYYFISLRPKAELEISSGGFRGPTSAPYVKGPTGPPPQ